MFIILFEMGFQKGQSSVSKVCEWNPVNQVWDNRLKHEPLFGKPWKDVVQWTGQRRQPARYKQNTSHTQQEMEMRCVSEGTEINQVRPNVKEFFYAFDDVIGASDGKETRFVYAEWHINGAVHGRPITQEELRRQGAKV